MAVSGAGYLSTSLNRREIPFPDLEHDIGLIPYDDDPVVAARNTTLLNEALEAMWVGGEFRTRNGILIGPIMYGIRCPAKEFFFVGTIKTHIRTGGALLGAGGKTYPLPEDSYEDGNQAGGVTRFTRIDGENLGAVIRLRGYGFRLDSIQFGGRRYESGDSGPTTGTKTPAGIEVEGRDAPGTGGHVITNCMITECTYGIRCIAGYYNDSDVFVSDESHADTSTVSETIFWQCHSCFRSENQQAVGWNFNNITVGGWGGAYQVDVIVFDIARGGNIRCNHLDILHLAVVLFKVAAFSPWTCWLECYGLFRDRNPVTNDTNYLTLLEYAGTGQTIADCKWNMRVTGQIHQLDDGTEYDIERIFDIPANFPITKLYQDVANIPTDNFTALGGWWTPDAYWQGL